jgi:hypothetical protein
MTQNFSVDWFDQLQINFNQAPIGMLGIHAYKEKKGCVYFEVPETWMNGEDFFRLVYAEAQLEWAKVKKEQEQLCPVCLRSLLGFQFRYRGQIFCRTCGSWLSLKDGKYILVKSIIK